MDAIKRDALDFAVRATFGKNTADVINYAAAFEAFLRSTPQPECKEPLPLNGLTSAMQPYSHGLPRPKRLVEEEARCAEGRTAPRVSLADIEAGIGNVYWMSAGKAALNAHAANGRGGNSTTRHPFAHNPLDLLTICLVVLRNGFVVVGTSAPASPENFDQKLGDELAYEDAVRKIWPMAGYALRDRLVRDLDKHPGAGI